MSAFARISNRAKRTIASLLAVIGITLGLVVGVAAPASASATWCLRTSQVKVLGISVPTGQYCFSVIGSGTRVDFTSGSWDGYVIVNPAEKVTFYDQAGNAYASWITYSKSGTRHGYDYWRSGINGYARGGGSVCGEMMAAGVTIGKICHRVG